MANPGPASTITEHPIGGGGSPTYVGVSGGSVGFYQDPYGGGAVAQRSGPVQSVLTVSAATGFLATFTSLSQNAPAVTAQNVSSTQVTFSGAPQLSTADVVVINKQIALANYGIGGTARVVSVSANANTALLALTQGAFSVSGVSSSTPGGDTFIMAAFRAPALVNSVVLSPSVVQGNSVSEQNFTVAGLQPGMMVALQKPTEQSGLMIGNVRVAAANTLAVQFVNVLNSAVTPTGSETYTYSAMAGAQGVSPIMIVGVNMGGATSGIASVITVSSGALTPSAINVTGINASDMVVGIGQNVEAMAAANSVALVGARVSAANVLSLTFLNLSAASITALSTDTWMIPVMRPGADAPMTIYSGSFPATTIGPNTCTEVGVTVTGLTVSCAVMVQKPSFTSGASVVGYRLSAAAVTASVVAVNIANPTSVSVSLPAETYLIGALKPLLGTGHYIQQQVAPLGVQGIALTNEMRNVLAGTGLMAGQ